MLRLLAGVLLLICLVSVAGSQTKRKARLKQLSASQDPGHQQFLFINGIRFSSPRGFNTRLAKTTNEVIYVPHSKYDLGIFVVASDTPVNKETIERVSALLASYLFPSETARYSWKEITEGYKKVSQFETGGGMLQGFNGQQRAMVQFRSIEVKRRQVTTGYIFGLGRGNEAKHLFEQNLGGLSMPGWYAQAHILASLTGEKYSQINPGTEIIGTLVEAPPAMPSDEPKKTLDMGQLDGLNYVNEFFGLSLSIPRDWLVVSSQTRTQIGEDSKKLLESSDPAKKAAISSSIDRSTPLLALTKLPAGQSNNASLLMIAERIPSPEIKNGADVLHAMKKVMSGTNFNVEFQGDINTEQIGGSDFAVATIKNVSPYGTFMQKIYVTVSNDYALQLFFTYSDETDLQTFDVVMRSIKFK